MRLRTLNESYPDVPKDWEVLSFNDQEALDGDEHGLFYLEKENILVEVYHHWDNKKLDVRAYAGDNVANGDLIAQSSYNYISSPDYITILSDISDCIDSVYDKIDNYGIGTIYQVLDKTSSIRDDMRDIISKHL